MICVLGFDYNELYPMDEKLFNNFLNEKWADCTKHLFI